MFSGLLTHGCRKRALYSVQQHYLEKQEGWSQDAAVWAVQDWAGSPELPAGIVDSSVAQHNRIHLLSEDISFYGTYMLSKTSFNCPMKLILCNYSSLDQELQPTIPASLRLASVSRISPFLIEILNHSWACFVNPAEANLWSRTDEAPNFQDVSTSYSFLHKCSNKKV